MTRPVRYTTCARNSARNALEESAGGVVARSALDPLNGSKARRNVDGRGAGACGKARGSCRVRPSGEVARLWVVLSDLVRLLEGTLLLRTHSIHPAVYYTTNLLLIRRMRTICYYRRAKPLSHTLALVSPKILPLPAAAIPICLRPRHSTSLSPSL